MHITGLAIIHHELFQTLSHLQLILVRKVFHYAMNLDTMGMTFLNQLICDHLQSILDIVRYKSSVRARNGRRWVCLADHV